MKYKGSDIARYLQSDLTEKETNSLEKAMAQSRKLGDECLFQQMAHIHSDSSAEAPSPELKGKLMAALKGEAETKEAPAPGKVSEMPTPGKKSLFGVNRWAVAAIAVLGIGIGIWQTFSVPEFIIIKGQAVIGPKEAPEKKGAYAKNVQVFLEGLHPKYATNTDAKGRFELKLAYADLPDSHARGQKVRLFAWKDYSKLPKDGGWAKVKLGSAHNVTIQRNIDLGTFPIKWTNAGWFVLNFPEGTPKPYPVGNITVKGIPLLGTIESDPDTGNFNVEYLPPKQNYVIQIRVPGYEDLDYTFEDWPSKKGKKGWWFKRRGGKFGTTFLPQLKPK